MPLPPGQRKPFLTREVTPVRLLALRTHVKRCQVLSSANLLPGDWREWTKIDKGDCPHTSGTMIEVENDHGYYGVIICNDCGELDTKECAHAHCSWHLDGTVLLCDNCGVDCT